MLGSRGVEASSHDVLLSGDAIADPRGNWVTVVQTLRQRRDDPAVLLGCSRVVGDQRGLAGRPAGRDAVPRDVQHPFDELAQIRLVSPRHPKVQMPVLGLHAR